MASMQPMEKIPHATNIPTIYRTASKIARQVKEGKDSLKNLVYNCRARIITTVYRIVVETFKREDIIDDLIQKSQLLVKAPTCDLWLAKVLIWNMLWGQKQIRRGSKPVELIYSHEKVLRELLKDCQVSTQHVLMHDISKPRYVRVNTLKITTEEAVNNFVNEGWRLIPFSDKSDYKGFQDCLNNLNSDEFIRDIHIPNLLIFPPKTQFYQHDAYAAGCIILQDKASCLPVHLLAPPPGSIVLDSCAAPGMKTTQLAALLQNKGTVYAVEVHPKREAVLRQLVESAGAKCVKTIFRDVMTVTDQVCQDVEYILVDPSCSGSGITDRVEVTKSDLSTKMERLKKLCNFQAKLLRHTMKSFPKAKRIVYSTCSLNSEENEDVVRQVLETSREFKLVNAKEKLESWNTKTSDIYPQLGNMCIFATPEEDKTNGFFVAVFERLQKGERNPYLNYELCMLYDKKLRRQSNYDDDQETNVFDVKKEKSSYTNENNENFQENKEYIKDELSSIYRTDENESTDKFTIKRTKDKKRKIKSEDVSIDSSKSHKKLKKDKKESHEDIKENSIEEDHTLKVEKKKSKKLDKNENGNTEFVENFIEFDSTLKGEKKKKKNKNKNLEENENAEISNEVSKMGPKSEKLKKNKSDKHSNEENVATENFYLKKEKKSKNKKLDTKESDNTDLHLDDSSVLNDTLEKKKNKKLDTKESVNTDQHLDDSSVLNDTLEKKKKKNKKLDTKESDNTDQHLDDSSVLNDTLEKKKKKKNKKLDTKESDNTDLHLDDSSVLNDTLEKKKKKNKKLDTKESDNTDLHLDDSSVLNDTLEKKKKKNKKLDTKESDNTDQHLDDSSVLNDTSEKKNKKNKKLDTKESDNTDQHLDDSSVLNDTLEKKKKKKNKKLDKKENQNADISNEIEIMEMESKSEKNKKKKCDEPTDKENIRTEHLDSKKEKKNKNKKLDTMENDNTEYSIVFDNTLEREKMKNLDRKGNDDMSNELEVSKTEKIKKKKSEKRSNDENIKIENIDLKHASVCEEQNTEVEINSVSDLKKSGKTKKRKRTSTDEENFEESKSYIEDSQDNGVQDVVKYKTKKAKK